MILFCLPCCHYCRFCYCQPLTHTIYTCYNTFLVVSSSAPTLILATFSLTQSTPTSTVTTYSFLLAPHSSPPIIKPSPVPYLLSISSMYFHYLLFFVTFLVIFTCATLCVRSCVTLSSCSIGSIARISTVGVSRCVRLCSIVMSGEWWLRMGYYYCCYLYYVNLNFIKTPTCHQ